MPVGSVCNYCPKEHRELLTKSEVKLHESVCVWNPEIGDALPATSLDISATQPQMTIIRR